MSKLEGNILFTGSMGNLSAYKRRGSDKIILRTKGGASKDKIKNDPAFALTRKYNSEFGGCSKAAAFVRKAIIGLWHMADPDSTGQLNALAHTIQKLDTIHAAGERAIRFSQYRYLLDGFNMTSQLHFNTVIRHPVSVSVLRTNGSARLELPGLLPGVNFYTAPQYHLYRLTIVLGVIADLIFTNTGYRPENPLIYHPAFFSTPWFSTKEPLDAQSFDIRLENFISLEDSNSLVLSAGIEFGYPLNNNMIKAIKYAGCATILATG